MHLAAQRDAIREAIINEPEPQDMSWESKIAWERARIKFAQIVEEAADAVL